MKIVLHRVSTQHGGIKSGVSLSKNLSIL